MGAFYFVMKLPKVFSFHCFYLLASFRKFAMRLSSIFIEYQHILLVRVPVSTMPALSVTNVSNCLPSHYITGMHTYILYDEQITGSIAKQNRVRLLVFDACCSWIVST
jgi:hypothetical protein